MRLASVRQTCLRHQSWRSRRSCSRPLCCWRQSNRSNSPHLTNSRFKSFEVESASESCRKPPNLTRGEERHSLNNIVSLMNKRAIVSAHTLRVDFSRGLKKPQAFFAKREMFAFYFEACYTRARAGNIWNKMEIASYWVRGEIGFAFPAFIYIVGANGLASDM